MELSQLIDMLTGRSGVVLTMAKCKATYEIETWHMLYALAKEPNGIAHHVLRDYNVKDSDIEEEAKKITRTKDVPFITPLTPEYSVKSGQVLLAAYEECKTLDHKYIGTEHLLLGITKVKESAAYKILLNLGVDINDLRRSTLELLGIFDRNFELQDTDSANVTHVYLKDGKNRELVASYYMESNNLWLNQPMELNEIERIIAKVRGS